MRWAVHHAGLSPMMEPGDDRCQQVVCGYQSGQPGVHARQTKMVRHGDHTREGLADCIDAPNPLEILETYNRSDALEKCNRSGAVGTTGSACGSAGTQHAEITAGTHSTAGNAGTQGAAGTIDMQSTAGMHRRHRRHARHSRHKRYRRHCWHAHGYRRPDGSAGTNDMESAAGMNGTGGIKGTGAIKGTAGTAGMVTGGQKAMQARTALLAQKVRKAPPACTDIWRRCAKHCFAHFVCKTQITQDTLSTRSTYIGIAFLQPMPKDGHVPTLDPAFRVHLYQKLTWEKEVPWLIRSS
eukprot:1137949-Pelagomonas_calceolata.AAC.5